MFLVFDSYLSFTVTEPRPKAGQDAGAWGLDFGKTTDKRGLTFTPVFLETSLTALAEGTRECLLRFEKLLAYELIPTATTLKDNKKINMG